MFGLCPSLPYQILGTTNLLALDFWACLVWSQRPSYQKIDITASVGRCLVGHQ
jgi:hypothetical protein